MRAEGDRAVPKVHVRERAPYLLQGEPRPQLGNQHGIAQCTLEDFPRSPDGRLPALLCGWRSTSRRFRGVARRWRILRSVLVRLFGRIQFRGLRTCTKLLGTAVPASVEPAAPALVAPRDAAVRAARTNRSASTVCASASGRTPAATRPGRAVRASREPSFRSPGESTGESKRRLARRRRGSQFVRSPERRTVASGLRQRARRHCDDGPRGQRASSARGSQGRGLGEPRSLPLGTAGSDAGPDLPRFVRHLPSCARPRGESVHHRSAARSELTARPRIDPRSLPGTRSFQHPGKRS